MSRLSYGLSNAEQIESRAALIRATESARRALIAKQIKREQRETRADTVALFIAGAALAGMIVFSFFI